MLSSSMASIDGEVCTQERPALFQQLLQKSEGQRAEWEYPFAVTGINLTFMLQEVVDLRDKRVGTLVTERLPMSAPGQAFLDLLAETADVFEQVRHRLLEKHVCLQEAFTVRHSQLGK